MDRDYKQIEKWHRLSGFEIRLPVWQGQNEYARSSSHGPIVKGCFGIRPITEQSTIEAKRSRMRPEPRGSLPRARQPGAEAIAGRGCGSAPNGTPSKPGLNTLITVSVTDRVAGAARAVRGLGSMRGISTLPGSSAMLWRACGPPRHDCLVYPARIPGTALSDKPGLAAVTGHGMR